MTKRKSLIELKKIIKKEVEKSNYYIDAFSNDSNPQVEKMLLEQESKLEVYEDILKYIDNGSTWQFGGN